VATAAARKYPITRRQQAHLTTFVRTFSERARSLPLADGGRVFRGVTIIKAGLGNAADRHYYPAHVLKEAVDQGQFEKLRAYADHPSRIDETVQPERTIRDQVGLYTNVRFVREGERGGAVVGDLNVFRSQRWLAQNIEDLKEWGAADRIGISINGHGDTQEADIAEAGGKVNEVQNFRKIASADIVTEAGAGGGFQHLLESARAARQEQTIMGKKEKLLTKIAEAAKRGDAAKVETLTEQLRECMSEEADAKATKKDKVKEAKKPTKKAAADDEAEETREAAEPEEDDAEDADAEDELEEADAEEEDEADEEDDEEAEDPEETREAVSSLRDRFNRGTKVIRPGEEKADKTRENAIYTTGAKKNMAAKGGAKAGAGSMTKKSTQTTQKARRYAETEGAAEPTETERLKEALEAITEENRQLKAKMNQQAREAAAARVVKKVKGLDKDTQDKLAAKLVRECRTKAEMEEAASFYSSLVESARSRDEEFDEDSDGEVDGMPSRFRESFANGEAGPDDFLEELGLPIKQAQTTK